MKFLITPDAMQGDAELPCLYEFDTHTGSGVAVPKPEELTDEYRFRPFGITKNGSELIVASNTKIGLFDFESKNFLDILPIPAFDATHMIVVHDDMIITANTANDTLTICRGGLCRLFSMQTLSFVDSVKPHNDLKHINSVAVIDDLLHVMAHSDCQHGSAIYVIDMNDWRVVKRIAGGNQCHGIVKVGETMYSLSTGTGDVLEYGDKNIHYNICKYKDGFLRGLQAVGEKLYFGSSFMYQNVGEKGNCHIYEWDTVAKRVTNKWHIQEVLILNDFLVIEDE